MIHGILNLATFGKFCTVEQWFPTFFPPVPLKKFCSDLAPPTFYFASTPTGVKVSRSASRTPWNDVWHHRWRNVFQSGGHYLVAH